MINIFSCVAIKKKGRQDIKGSILHENTQNIIPIPFILNPCNTQINSQSVTD